MKVEIIIQCDNEAFGDYPEFELARILLERGHKIRGAGPLGEGESKIMDINGNSVGFCRVEID